ncbi:hypothetical protein HY571_00030 [Candidatus Micrarchaeota archaeon]|nr:hypothetical protein [Candidatus Micrarchaeota archaeon]
MTRLNPSSPYLLLPLAAALFLLVYLVTLEVFAGVLSLAAFLAYVSLDLFKNKKKSSFLEIVYALAAALAVWIVLSVILQTPSPLDVVTSCSMRPFLDRGDLVIVQGQGMYAAPIVDYQGELPRVGINKTTCSVVVRDEGETLQECTNLLLVRNSSSDMIIPVNRKNVSNNDVVIFESPAGLVIHRAVLTLRNTNSQQVVYLTKGDNNPVIDQEGAMPFVLPRNIHGRMLLRIPLVGYFRLFLAGQFQEPRGCNTSVG